MKDTARVPCSPIPPGDTGIKVRSRRLPAATPAYLGTLTSRNQLSHAFADGTLLPVIAGGSVGTVEVEKPSLLTIPEFAAEIRVARSTAWRMVKNREIETIVVGRNSRRIPRQALDEYIAKRRAEAKAFMTSRGEPVAQPG